MKHCEAACYQQAAFICNLMANDKSQNFPALTGIRFVAASMVFLFHYAHEFFTASKLSFGYYFFRQLNVGVNLFFVLSGFLITHRYFDDLFSWQNLRAYLLKRGARILPLYYAVVLMQLLMFHIHGRALPSWQVIVLNLTLLKGLNAEYFYSILTQSWSLTVEEMFYLFAPVFFFFTRRKVFIPLQPLLLIGVGFLMVKMMASPKGVVFFDSNEFMLAGTFFGRCTEFFLGMWLARYIQNKRNKRQGTTFTYGGALLVLVLISALAFYAFQNNIPEINSYTFGILLFNFLIPFAIAVFFYGLIEEESAIKKILSNRWTVLLGKSSYAFYLLHIGMLAEVFFFQITSNLLALYFFLQLVSIFAYKFYEKPTYFAIVRLCNVPVKTKSYLEKSPPLLKNDLT
ncbi:MAG: acyltransferase [Chitinophagaceae bacterium]|nr:MAG: acyltransferase [Chitinophagaceae bacterium]